MSNNNLNNVNSINNLNSFNRIIEIDILKGIAVILMIISHIVMFTNVVLKNIKYKLKLNEVIFLSIISHCTFITLVGVNLVLSYNKNNSPAENIENKSKFIKKNIRRALIIFGYGIIMSLLSRFFFGDWYIIFGIFQFIGVSIVLSIPFVINYTFTKIILGILLLIITSLVKPKNSIVHNFLVGKINIKFMDYFPLIPYFGLILLGIFIGNIIHKYKSDPELKKRYSLNLLSSIGKHSIHIYFTHLILIFIFVRIVVNKPIINV